MTDRTNLMNYPLPPIAVIRSPFREKFATPRQPGLTPSVISFIDFYPEFGSPEAVRGLDSFSHIWLLFLFHQNLDQGWHPTVRPPRFDGNKRIGVYASRSPFRPNPLGLSAVQLLAIEKNAGKISLQIGGADLIDGTPILDIKPYIPYGDSISHAQAGFAAEAPVNRLEVEFSDTAQRQLQMYSESSPTLETMIVESLRLDPRPAYRRSLRDHHTYGVILDRYNVRWKVVGDVLSVLDISPTDMGSS